MHIISFLASAVSGDTTTDTPAGTGGVSQAQNGLNAVNDGNKTGLEASIKTILSAVFVLIGIISVVMIILGGITYATSQGDPGKVKKGKDTILYGVIGLVVALLAFAIVQFVLDALK